jgi:hypothetical protein
MIRAFIAAACIASGAALSGCAGLTTLLASPTGKDETLGQAVLQHLELCRRTYRGALGAGVTGSFEIECPAQASGTVPPHGSQGVVTPPSEGGGVGD